MRPNYLHEAVMKMSESDRRTLMHAMVNVINRDPLEELPITSIYAAAYFELVDAEQDERDVLAQLEEVWRR